MDNQHPELDAYARAIAAVKRWAKSVEEECKKYRRDKVGSGSRPESLIPFIPSGMKAVESMLSLAEIQSSDVIYDLGCGDGRIIIAAAKQYGARGVGIDIRPDLIERCQKRAEEAGVEKLVQFVCGNFFQVDIRKANLVIVYLLSWALADLRNKFLAELRPGSRIVSNAFRIEGWKPEKTLVHTITYPFFLAEFKPLIKYIPVAERFIKAILYYGVEEMGSAEQEIRALAERTPELKSAVEMFMRWAKGFYSSPTFHSVYLYRMPPILETQVEGES